MTSPHLQDHVPAHEDRLTLLESENARLKSELVTVATQRDTAWNDAITKAARLAGIYGASKCVADRILYLKQDKPGFPYVL